MLKNLNNAFSDSKNRVVILVILVSVILSISFGLYGLKSKGKGVAAASSVGGAPAVDSIPGVGEPTREYAKLQREQNIAQAEKAAKTGTSAVPTIIRASYIGTDEFSKDREKAVADTDNACSVQSLRRARRAGVSAFELRCRGCSAEALRGAGYTAGELRAAGFSAQQLRDAGFNAAELRAAGFSAAELKKAGFSAKELLSAGYSAGELRAAGFTAAELKAAGLSAKDLAAAGFEYDALRAVGFTAKALNAVGLTKSSGENKNCNPDALRKSRSEGVKASELRARGCDVAALRAAGFTAGELRDAGFSAAELKKAGFTAAELKAAGFSARELKAVGFSAKELLDAGFSVRDLKNAGFSAGELKRAGVSAADLKAAGFSAKELRKAGFSASELKEAGFSAEDLMSAGFSQGELIRAGFSPRKLGSIGEPGKAEKEPKAFEDPTQDPANPPLNAKVTTKTRDKIVGLNTGGGSASDDAVLARLQQRQAEQLSQQERQQRVDQFQQGMGSQANQLISSWSPPPMQQFVMGAEVEKSASNPAQATLTGPALDSSPSGIASILAGPKTSIKAGSILFAILDTGVNSDEDSPIMATVIQGELKGAKLIGKFRRTGEKVLLSFDTLSVPGLTKSLQVSAVAIDQDTARTAMADEVNSHYLLRYGTLFAASFMDGLSSAISQSGTKVDTSTVAVSVNNEELNNTKLGLIALGKVGKQYASSLNSNFTVPPTIKLTPGKGLGILFMQDLEFAMPIIRSQHRVIE